tara:strand:- start:689 stop:1087 length:399 start_codon:yes stop_codon:yes gene_type:complete
MDIELWAAYVDHVRSNHKQDKHSHPCCNVWRSDDGTINMGQYKPSRFKFTNRPISGSVVTSDTSSVTIGATEPVSEESKQYVCPRGHTFSTTSPIVVAVDNDPDYNTGPICGYCYVDWFKANLNADEIQLDS